MGHLLGSQDRAVYSLVPICSLYPGLGDTQGDASGSDQKPPGKPAFPARAARQDTDRQMGATWLM